MITIGTLRELRDTPLYESGDDYLPGIELEDLEMFSESAFVVDIKDTDDEILTEGVGSEIWSKIKKAFQAIINFFKMLGSKIKGFITGFFKKAEDAVDKAEKEPEGESSSGSKTGDIPEKEQEEIKDLEDEIKEKQQEIKETPAEDKEKVADLKEDITEAKEKIEKIKRKYTRSNSTYKDASKTTITLYIAGGFTTIASVRHAAMDALVFSANIGNSSIAKDVMSSEFYDELKFFKDMSNDPNSSDEDRNEESRYINKQANKTVEYAKAILAAKVDYSDPKTLDRLFMRLINGELQSRFISVKDKIYKKSEVISEIKNVIKDSRKFLNAFMEDSKNAQEVCKQIISDMESYQKDPANTEYAHIFKLQAQCCNKLVGVISKMTSMHVASIRKAIQYDIQQLNHFKNAIKN